MSVLITGSVAYDTIFSHEGEFARQLSGDLRNLNTTFLASSMRRDFGGCAANIALAMKRLGGDPVIWGALGMDGEDYLARFRSFGISTEGLQCFPDVYTAQCVIFTDSLGSQLAVFHPGAMKRSREVPWPRREGKDHRPKLAILSPGGKETTLNAANECVSRGIPYLFDVGQELNLFSAEELESLLSRSFGIAYSDFEAEGFEAKTGLSSEAIGRTGKLVLRTHGSRGASLFLPGAGGAVPVEPLPVAAQNPVGAGDAMRGGFLYGLARGLDPVASARIGAIVAARKVASLSAQDYPLTLDGVRKDYEGMWGAAGF